jgi:hypothetical protein
MTPSSVRKVLTSSFLILRCPFESDSWRAKLTVKGRTRGPKRWQGWVMSPASRQEKKAAAFAALHNGEPRWPQVAQLTRAAGFGNASIASSARSISSSARATSSSFPAR